MRTFPAPTESRHAGPLEKIRSLSVGPEPAFPLTPSLAEVARLSFVQSILALPDFHQKDDMEVPSSLAITTRNVIVPEFTSVAVNDGMGIVATNLRAADMTPDRQTAFFSSVNANSAQHFFDTNRYSLTPRELREVIVHGGKAVLGKYGLGAETLERFEHRGAFAQDRDGAELDLDAVPIQLLLTRFARSEMGLNFGGNHFLEIQVVDEVLDTDLGRAWGLERDQVVLMYHLGPGPFSGTLLHHYSRRSKLYGARVPLYFFSKLLFHFVQRMGREDLRRKWTLHFKRNRWTPLPERSEEGILFLRALAMATNFGYAYRLATVRAILDGLHEAVSADIAGSLFCDISHNGIERESFEGEDAWVARHNACRLVAGKPTIVAGSAEVPSYLGIGLDGSGGRYHSYDHGAGSIIEGNRKAGRLEPASGVVHQHVMSRGRSGGLIKKRELPVSRSQPIDRLMGCLDRARILRPVIRLRPLANLKN